MCSVLQYMYIYTLHTCTYMYYKRPVDVLADIANTQFQEARFTDEDRRN